MLFVNRSRTALLLVTLMLLSSILPGCIESVEELAPIQSVVKTANIRV